VLPHREEYFTLSDSEFPCASRVLIAKTPQKWR
jgi:hypothetical protein